MKFRYSFLIAFLSIMLVSQSFAGDKQFLRFVFPVQNSTIQYGDDTPIEVEIRNNNPTYPVLNNQYIIECIRISDGAKMFSGFQMGDTLNPKETRRINFGGFTWEKMTSGKFRLDFTTTENYDENPGNNNGSVSFTVKSPYIPRDSAINSMNYYINNKYDDLNLNTSVGYLSQNYITDKDTISFGPYGIDSFAPEKHYYYGLLDFDYFGYYPHSTRFLLIDAKSGSVDQDIPVSYWPMINGSGYPSAEEENNDMILGDPMNVPAPDEDDYIFEIDNDGEKKKGCAILISGAAKNQRERNGFDNSVNLVSRELVLERKGPRLTPGSVFVLYASDSSTVDDAIDAVSEECEKLFVYYIGHGDSTKGMVLQDTTYTYKTLVDKVMARDVKEICFIVDACYSGHIVEIVQAHPNKGNFDITIATSARRDTVSKFVPQEKTVDGETTQTGIGALTNELLMSWGETAADANGDSTITLKEAMDRALEQNRRLWEGDTVRFRQFGPQIFTQQKREVKTSGILDFSESDMYVNVIEGLDGEFITVALGRGRNLFEEPDHPLIIGASRNRIWDISLENGSQGFEVDLEFIINPNWDIIPDGGGQIGLIYNTNPVSKEWQPHYPSVYNELENIVTAKVVEHFSEWALARIADEANSVSELDWPGLFVSIYPNPFAGAARISFSLEQSSVVRLEIYNSLGEKIETLHDGLLNPGEFTVTYDGSKYPSGAYYAKFIINGSVRAFKLIKSE